MLATVHLDLFPGSSSQAGPICTTPPEVVGALNVVPPYVHYQNKKSERPAKSALQSVVGSPWSGEDQPWRTGDATPPRSSTGGNSCNAGKRAGNPCTPFVGPTGFRDPCSMPGAASSPNATLRLPPREATSPPLLPPAPSSCPSTSVPLALPR